jgi:hypothetical protein
VDGGSGGETLYRQKIQLSENIEKSLVMMKCPHPLQAHQIQGLDYPAVFPVVRWLVKKVGGSLLELSIAPPPSLTSRLPPQESPCRSGD